MARLKIALAILILVTLLILPSIAHAQPNVCGFYGTVTLDLVPLEDGTIVKAWIDNIEVASTTTYTNTDVNPPIPSYYALTIDGTGHDFEGKRVTFTVGDDDLHRDCPCPSAEAPIYESGANTALDITTASLAGECFVEISLSPDTGFATNVCGWWCIDNWPITIYFDGKFYTTTMTDSEGNFCVPIIPPHNKAGRIHHSCYRRLGDNSPSYLYNTYSSHYRKMPM